MASSSGAQPTPPPLRLTLKSYDKLTQISMKVRWIDEHGEEQTWNSWEDALCGRFGATKVLPSSSTGIQVRFRSQPGGRKVHGVDRKSRSAWTRRGEEVIELRPDASDEVGGKGVDAWFEMRGPITHCHVWRAWNSCNGGRPDEWEWWPDFPEDRRAPPPATLQAADAAAPWPGSCEMSPASSSSDEASCTSAVTGAMSRLVAAAAVLLAVRRRTLKTLEELNKQITKQWYRVNSGNTAAAGLAVASFGSLFVAPPLAIAFGAGSAVTGVGSSTQDAVVEAEKGRNLAKLMEIDLSEQLGFESVESELRCALSSAASHQRSSPRRHAGRALAVYTQTANLMLVRSAKYVTLTQAGTETMLIAGRVLGGLGAGLAVGVAVHGWSTTKPMQKLVQEKIAEVERSIEYLDGVHQRISGALRCPCCEEPLGLGATSTLRRCPQFHCFHAACVGEDGSCPVCAKSVSDLRAADQLPALLGLVGLRDLCTLTVDSLTPQIRKGAELVQRLGGRVDEVRRLISGVQKDADDEKRPGEETPTSRQRREQALHEDAETHEAWQEFLASRDLAELETEELEGLLLGRRGMPLKYRHLLWPKLLSLSSGDYEALTVAELPQKVLDQINADVPRTRRDLVAPERRDALRRVLHATAAKRPHVGYAQGMNQLAAVLLKLGFDEGICCWMMDAINEELLPGCHHPDLHGLFRDTAVADILIQTFLPNHAIFFESAGIEVLWFTVDYFITLGSADSSLPLIATLWDLCLLRGPRGLFSGFLAVLEMYFPLPGDREERKELSEPEAMMARYKEALAEASGEGLADCVADFLHHRQGGVSSELVASLRNSVGGAG